MNTPQLESERLILRKFTDDDLDALCVLLKDEDTNTFLPWFLIKTKDEAAHFFQERFADHYQKPCAYNYAICLKDDNYPIGYVNVNMDDSHDFGYGLRKEFWHGELSSQVQHLAKKDFERRSPAKAFARTKIEFSNRVCQLLGSEQIHIESFWNILP